MIKYKMATKCPRWLQKNANHIICKYVQKSPLPKSTNIFHMTWISDAKALIYYATDLL